MLYDCKPSSKDLNFSSKFLEHPQRSRIMRLFDTSWDDIHKLLPRLGYGLSDVSADEVFERYERLREFIDEITNWRMKHNRRAFWNILPYVHFLAGVLALFWVRQSQNKIRGCFPAEIRDRMPRMMQAALDHLTMAADLEVRHSHEFRNTTRETYTSTVINCALAEAYCFAYHLKAFLPLDSAPFMRQDLVDKFERSRAKSQLKARKIDPSHLGWLPTCIHGLYRFANLKVEPVPEPPKLNVTDDLFADYTQRQLIDQAHLRWLYLWKRMEEAYRECEQVEYRKAAMTHWNMHNPEVMPLMPWDGSISWTLIRDEKRYFYKHKLSFMDLSKRLLSSLDDSRLTLALIFAAPSLRLTCLFRRALYHGRALHEGTHQARFCQEACEAALKTLPSVKLGLADQDFFHVNLTALLARAIAAQVKDIPYADATARGVLETINAATLHNLPLKDRWFYHKVATSLIGGPHKSLATRGRKLALKDGHAKVYDTITDAKALIRLMG